MWFYSYLTTQSSLKHSFILSHFHAFAHRVSFSIIQGPSHSPLTNFYLSFTALFKCYLPLSPSPKQNLPLLYHHFFMILCIFHHGAVFIFHHCSFQVNAYMFVSPLDKKLRRTLSFIFSLLQCVERLQLHAN